MSSQDHWTWPSTDCNGIPLADAVTVSFQGTVVVLAREKNAVVDALYYNVRVPGSETGSASEWVGWNILPMTEPSQSEKSGPSQPSADAYPLIRIAGMDLLTVDKTATVAKPADAPFRAVTDGRTISCFRQSAHGSLYVDRFVLVQAPGARAQQDSGESTWVMRRVWEVRYQRSELRDVPTGPRDTLGPRNLIGEPFLEPTIELPGISGINAGAFDVALAPTADAQTMRWHIVAVTGPTLTCWSYPQDASGRIDLNPETAFSFTITPAAAQASGPPLTLTPYAGVAVATYHEQDELVAGDGTKAKLRRITRLMITAPVKMGAGSHGALAVYDFTVQADGTITAYPAGAMCAPADGTLNNGVFTTNPPKDGGYPVPDGAVLAAGTGTITSVLLGQPQPAGAPALLDSSDGLVHLYFPGLPAESGDLSPFLVAQFDPVLTRVEAAVPWTAGSVSGTFPLTGLRPGTSLNGLSVAVADCQGQADLCEVSIAYGNGSGLPDEMWHGVPRDALTFVAILNGQSSGDPSDPSVLSGAVPFYDLGGKLAMARLPLASDADAAAHLSLVSHRPDVTLASAEVSALSGGTATLTLGFSLPGQQTAAQTWTGVPTNTAYLTPILTGDSGTYAYDAGASTGVYGIATDAGSILLFAAGGHKPTITVGSATDGIPGHCKVTVTGLSNPLDNIPRDQASFITALRGASGLNALFVYISPGEVAGAVPNQTVSSAMDLRGLSLLFDVINPAPNGSLQETQKPISAAVLQGRTPPPPAPPVPPADRGMRALAAAPPAGPLLGARAIVQNDASCDITKGANGRWLAAAPPSALSFDGQNAVVVDEPGRATAPTRTWTVEAWVCPADGKPSRVVAYNGAEAPPLAGVAPSYFLGTVGKDALQYASFTRGFSSYVHVPANQVFQVGSGQGFTWEAWVRPDVQPCPAGGSNVLGCLLQGAAMTGAIQWQLGLDHGRHLVYNLLTTDPDHSELETYLKAPDPLPATTWTHVAVTGLAVSGEAGKTSWTFTLYVDAMEVYSAADVIPYPVSQSPFLCIGSTDTTNVSVFGALAEIRLWTFAATPAELSRTMHASLTGNEPGLAGYWPLDEEAANGTFRASQTFVNLASVTGKALNGSLNPQPSQAVTSSSDGLFVQAVAGVGGAPAVRARGFLPANNWNHLAAVYQAAGALSLNPHGVGGRTDYGICQSASGLSFGRSASVDAWVQMSASTKIAQTILAQWGPAQQDQAFQFGVDANGHPFCSVTLIDSAGQVVLTGTVPPAAPSVIDGKPHHLAATFELSITTQPVPAALATITVYVDGQQQAQAQSGRRKPDLRVAASAAPVTVGISSLSTPASGPVAYSAQAPFIGVLTGARFWSATLTPDQVQAAMNGRQDADASHGVVSAWWFSEQTGVLAADTVSGNDLTLSDTDMWAAFAAIATLDLYGNGMPLGPVRPAPAAIAGGYQGDPQLTLGAYLDSGSPKNCLTGQLAEVRIWGAARSRDQIAETMYHILTTDEINDEPELRAYWTLNNTLVDQTGKGADGKFTGTPPPCYVTSKAPLTNEGPQVRNVYNGTLTRFQEPLTGRAAAIEYAQAQVRWDGSPYAVMRRAYFYANPALALSTGYGLGELGMIFIGQAQTNPTLIGYIEGAPPCPSENLSRPLYMSPFAYNGYQDATSVTLRQDDTTSLRFTSSDYRTRLQMDLDFKAGVRGDGAVYGGVGYMTKLFALKFKLGAHHKSSLTEASQRDEVYGSAWTRTLTDTMGLRGMWEPDGQYLNPVVGRRYQPLNFGYALVESLTADIYAVYLRSTGAMVGRVVVPSPGIPPDRNVLTFQINPSYVKNGTLDGKVGLVNDPQYSSADVQRGSYFQPQDAYRRAAAIDREEANLRAYYQQFNAPERGESAGLDTPTLASPAAQQFYDFSSGTARRGIVNRYVWTATGGLHAETEQFSAVHERTFTGLYSYTHGTGLVNEFETGTLVGVFGGLDLLFGGQIKVQVGQADSETHALSLNVAVVADPFLQGYDASDQTSTWAGYSTANSPGKVEAYRFMTFYLPPSPANADAFTGSAGGESVVDTAWLNFSGDPNAIALRQAQINGNGAWRVLHRVTYVSRVPPPLDTNPAQTVAPEPPQAIDAADNAALIALVRQALGKTPPSPASIGAAVAAVLTPADAKSGLGAVVPWWADFLQSTRGDKPDQNAVVLMGRLLNNTVAYMQAASEAGWPTTPDTP